MSNEHSASAPNLVWDGLNVNHQWSKSADAEVLISEAVASYIGSGFSVGSFLRNRSELWVAQQLVTQRDVLRDFRSCNRAFRQVATERATNWCGECDKCLFINLVLAPFLSRAELTEIFGGPTPLTKPELAGAIASLVGIGHETKPFECVGDPDECAVALASVSDMDEYRDCEHLRELARAVGTDRTMDELLQPQGVSRVPAAWL
jgi:hypothetical protein